MKISCQRWVIPVLAVLCGIAAITMIPSVHLPRAESASRTAGGLHAIPSPGLDSLNATSPSMQEVVAKHLFVSQRKATGQHSFPDLIVKGVFLGTERSIVFSLKSKPQANLRVWAGNVNSALSQITDPRDPRQPIADFLREWNIKEISFSGVTLTHFITGETETYAVDYDPEKKVKDDAARGYGQGIMSQDAPQTAGAKASTGTNPAQAGQAPSGTPPVNLMADRVSEMLKRMSPDEQKQFMKLVGKNTTGANQNGNTPSKSSAPTGTKSTQGSTKTSTSKKTK